MSPDDLARIGVTLAGVHHQRDWTLEMADDTVATLETERLPALLRELVDAAPKLLARVIELEGLERHLAAVIEAETSLLRNEVRGLRDELTTEAETAARQSTTATDLYACDSRLGAAAAYRDAAKRVSTLLKTLDPTPAPVATETTP